MSIAWVCSVGNSMPLDGCPGHRLTRPRFVPASRAMDGPCALGSPHPQGPSRASRSGQTLIARALTWDWPRSTAPADPPRRSHEHGVVRGGRPDRPFAQGVHTRPDTRRPTWPSDHAMPIWPLRLRDEPFSDQQSSARPGAARETADRDRDAGRWPRSRRPDGQEAQAGRWPGRSAPSNGDRLAVDPTRAPLAGGSRPRRSAPGAPWDRAKPARPG